MKVFLLAHKEGFMTLTDLDELKLFRGKFIGNPMAHEWKPLRIEEIENNALTYDPHLG